MFTQISKLRELGVTAIRITTSDSSSYPVVESGQYRLGIYTCTLCELRVDC